MTQFDIWPLLTSDSNQSNFRIELKRVPNFLFQETSQQLFSALELTFSIDLSPEEGGTSVELIKGGRDIEVNATNVYTYVRKYSHYR